ncbi:TetR/AcrR family transcriptional regulator [Actinoplanes sp. N902-109]|uniref:TetR/AcrR family transcriptional regulator n=1 Tax=Actinoplanes sp. (strain N902-109) TaxID=649831 RepID=UPI0003294E49|nr:TetR/AcrR family transcriptional regulator [Actinoplanes sp. N902-109]AGL15513.1 TetR family transcriptional regulator [Actinoplanes sp. N902-109]
MPKQVDHEERRRLLAEAVFAVIGTRGFEAVSLRDVAEQAGVSMGTVQHYFPTKQQMLMFALSHMRARVLARLQATLAALHEPSRRDLIRAATAVMLPVDPAGREEACVNVAFFSAATVTPAYAEQLRTGYGRLLAVSVATFREAAAAGELRAGVDPEQAAPELYFLTQGLVGPILVGLYRPEEALALVDAQLDRLFRA